MNTFKNYMVWGCLLFIVSCGNLSDISNQGLNGPEEFAYYSVLSGQPHHEQATKITWKMLEDVTYKAKWNKDIQLDFMYPIFGSNIKKLNGQQLSIKGYMIPLNIKEGLYAISRYTYASCFFCGQSGVESVISLKFKTKPRRYKTDAYVTVQGTMELNDTNVNDFIYIFRNTEEVK